MVLLPLSEVSARTPAPAHRTAALPRQRRGRIGERGHQHGGVLRARGDLDRPPRMQRQRDDDRVVTHSTELLPLGRGRRAARYSAAQTSASFQPAVLPRTRTRHAPRRRDPRASGRSHACADGRGRYRAGGESPGCGRRARPPPSRSARRHADQEEKSPDHDEQHGRSVARSEHRPNGMIQREDNRPDRTIAWRRCGETLTPCA